jgi:hypothetical protein
LNFSRLFYRHCSYLFVHLCFFITIYFVTFLHHYVIFLFWSFRIIDHTTITCPLIVVPRWLNVGKKVRESVSIVISWVMPYHYIMECFDLARTFTIRTNIVKFKSLFTSPKISTKKKLCTFIRCITKSHLVDSLIFFYHI